MGTKPDFYISIDEAGNPNDGKPSVISAVLIEDLDSFLKAYDISLMEAKMLMERSIKYFKWSEDSPKPFKLGKNVKGIFVDKVLSSLRGISIIVDNKGEKMSEYSTFLYGKIPGLKLREYVRGRKIFVYYDRSPILRGADRELIRINFPKWTLATIVGIDFTGHDRSKLIHPADYVSGIVREFITKDEFKREYRQFLQTYYEKIKENFRVEIVNLVDYM